MPKLASFRRPDQVAHGVGWERGSLDNLAAQNASGPALRNSLYGKTGHDVPAGTCSPRKIGSWSITADGALLALADMADRHGHAATHAHLASIYRYALDFVPWWAKNFGDEPGPGEYGVVEPCWTREEMLAKRPNSDSDLGRHYGADGLLRLGVHPAVRAIGGWTDAEIRAFTDHHFEAQLRKKPLGQGELLRAPYVSSCLIGCAVVYRALGDQAASLDAYDKAKGFWYRTLVPAIYWKGSKLGPLPTYGPWVQDPISGEYHEPWRYGYYPWGLQSWYAAMMSQELIQIALEALRRADHAFFRVAVRWILDIANWCDPRNVAKADLVPLASAGDPVRVANMLLQGGTDGSAPDGAFVTDRAIAGGHLMSVEDWEKLTPSDWFHRGHIDKNFNADGGVWQTVYVDPRGGKHARKKWSDGGFTPKPMTLDTLNAGGLLDALWVKALVFGDAELTRILEIRLSVDMAFANSTDTRVQLGRGIEAMGIAGVANVGAPGRAWAWRIKAGAWARAMMIGSPGGDSAAGDDASALVAAAKAAGTD